ALGLGAAGAVASIALALALTLWVGLHGARPAAGGVAPHWRPWVLLALPLATFHLCLHGAMQFDLAVLKSRIAALAMAAGDAPGRAAAQAARFAAYYRAAQTFAFIPYQMVMSLAFVLFPTLARHLARGDARQTEQALCQTLRLAWLVLVPAATWVSANALQLMQVAYPAGYVAGAPALRWLVWGVAALALVVVQATALNAAGRAWWSTGVAALGLGAVLFGTRYAIDRTGPVPGALAAAGAATALAHVALFAISALSVWLLFRARLAWRTLLRVGLAAAVMAGITRLWPGPGLWALLRSLVAGGLGYVGLLVLFGEVGREDWQSLRTLLPQAKPPSGAG
ncbi:MAG: lipid II flippase MurJ, partial [Polyangiales bacterium]